MYASALQESCYGMGIKIFFGIRRLEIKFYEVNFNPKKFDS